MENLASTSKFFSFFLVFLFRAIACNSEREDIVIFPMPTRISFKMKQNKKFLLLQGKKIEPKALTNKKWEGGNWKRTDPR